MALRDEALRHVVGLDSKRSAELALKIAQKEAQAESGAVLAVEGDEYSFFATTTLVQCDTEQFGECWAGDGRRTLEAGLPVIAGSWMVIPVGEPLLGVLYIGRARVLMTAAMASHLKTELGTVIRTALELRHHEPEVRLMYDALVARTPLRQITRDKMEALLRIYSWNKSRVAREMGITRATLYKWMDRFGIVEGQ